MCLCGWCWATSNVVECGTHNFVRGFLNPKVRGGLWAWNLIEMHVVRSPYG